MYELHECPPNPLGIAAVYAGETPASACERLGVPPAVVAACNGGAFPQPGSMFVLPAFRGEVYVVRPEDDLASVCRRFGMTEEEFARINGCTYVYPLQRVYVRKGER